MFLNTKYELNKIMKSPVTIIYATMTGNAEDCARQIAGRFAIQGVETKLVNACDYPASRLTDEACVLFVTSTWGEGEPPDDAVDFWDGVQNLSAGALNGVRFSVYALGDQAYDEFCAFGKNCDIRMAEAGGERLLPCVECDVDWEEPLSDWLQKIVPAVVALDLECGVDSAKG